MAMAGDVRREYLAQLRARAMERLGAEEREAGLVAPVSRRDSLRWLGMAAVAVVGAGPLRALTGPPETLAGSLGERAAMMGSMRTPAPQYGAPSWIAPREPNAPEPLVGKVTYSRTELADAKIWRDVEVRVVPEKGKTDWTGMKQTTAKEGYYSDSWGGGTHALLAIADPDTSCAFILRAHQTFYTNVQGNMYGCMVAAGVFSMHGSLFGSKGDNKSGNKGVTGVIADFTQVSDSAASLRDQDKSNINLEKGIPQEFWIRNGYNGWVQNYLGIAKAQRQDDLLALTLRSEGYPSEATFTVDLKAKTLVKTKFEGKEWTS